MTDKKCPCTTDVPDFTQNPKAALHQVQAKAAPTAFDVHPSTNALLIGACVSAQYQPGQICVNFPVVGQICFPVTLPIPAGSEVKVCMQTCGFVWGVPPFNGIEATVSFNGANLWSGVIWGSC